MAESKDGPLLLIEGVEKEFGQKVITRALDGVDLELWPGEFVALIGRLPDTQPAEHIKKHDLLMMLYCRNTLSILLLLAACMATAQNAIITGRVSDDKTNEGLFLETLSAGDFGAFTEIDGAFRLELPAGTHTLTVSSRGL